MLLSETVAFLNPSQGGTFVDCTLGLGGHTAALLEAGAGRVIGLDRDPHAIDIARARLSSWGDRVLLVHADYRALPAVLAEHGVGPIDGALADLGVSSMQLDDASRGMSFRAEGPLDMRMDGSAGETALDLIDRLDDDGLADVIYRYGEERRSRRVARCIKQARAQGELHTSLDLRRAVVRAVGPARIGGVDPATRTFQGLRIAVNGELDELEQLLAIAPEVVKAGGIVAIIAFHSLEDRLVKRALRDRALWRPLTKKPQVPSDTESNENPRARSAKLRAAERLDGDAAAPDAGEERDSSPGSDPGGRWYALGDGEEAQA
ncbi:MAG: 16S rRNA (cytosine(1402)-N(4))-methyltransferase RsmH [Minicystis sp.]